jgi:L-ascorbate metabolism protein UlaG (beta-lactamase superfamily)
VGALHVTATGNAGFYLELDGFTCAIDALWTPPPRFLGGPPCWTPPLRLDLILITHQHWDHFDARSVLRAASAGTVVIGPSDVVGGLGPGIGIRAIDPVADGGAVETRVGPARIACYGTTHGHAHNSYLIDVGGFRLFHDGDNEDTRTLSAQELRPVDVLMLCPWQGSGWQTFVKDLSPTRWLLAHLTANEINAHREGRFLPQLCDEVPIPERAVALSPGQTLTVEKVARTHRADQGTETDR